MALWKVSMLFVLMAAHAAPMQAAIEDCTSSGESCESKFEKSSLLQTKVSPSFSLGGKGGQTEDALANKQEVIEAQPGKKTKDKSKTKSALGLPDVRGKWWKAEDIPACVNDCPLRKSVKKGKIYVPNCDEFETFLGGCASDCTQEVNSWFHAEFCLDQGKSVKQGEEKLWDYRGKTMKDKHVPECAKGCNFRRNDEGNLLVLTCSEAEQFTDTCLEDCTDRIKSHFHAEFCENQDDPVKPVEPEDEEEDEEDGEECEGWEDCEVGERCERPTDAIGYCEACNGMTDCNPPGEISGPPISGPGVDEEPHECIADCPQDRGELIMPTCEDYNTKYIVPGGCAADCPELVKHVYGGAVCGGSQSLK